MRHDADELKESLSVDDIKLLLTELGAEHIHYNVNRDELITNTICHNHSGGSHKLYYKPSKYSFHCFTECGCSFNIYNLVEKVFNLRGKEIRFPQIIEFVASKTGKSKNIFGQGFLIPDEPKRNEELDWMNKLSKRKKVELSEPTFHSDKILEVFSKRHHESFYNDGISLEVLNAYEVKFYDKENAVIVPHRFHSNGKIVGIKMRNLDAWKIENGYKYIPVKVQDTLYNHPSYSNLYGLYQNKENIKRMKKVAIFESEKSVMQCATMFGHENNFTTALSGKNISQNQIDMLLELDIDEVIICMDKMYEDPKSDEALRYAAKILEMGRRFSKYVRVFTTWDLHGLIGYKESPSDRGKEVLMRLMKEKQEILNIE
ncbi:hypothetical protein [Bacillus sp. FJAT-22090]|uniref:hypothetical protein n=1 Tax=Bacillus sp. FJAT-22090 TaxID=1581038 RepID=UPI0011A533B7|nr:hypothetical protein [Bacillus sp. FJAT-22090]